MKIDKKEAQKQLANLQREVDRLKKIIETPEIDLFSITTYHEVCQILGESEHNSGGFFSMKEYRAHQLEKIERLFNGEWKPKFDESQYNYYPYFEYKNGRLVFYGVYGYAYYGGRVAYYKDRPTAEYVGRTFVAIYEGLAMNK